MSALTFGFIALFASPTSAADLPAGTTEKTLEYGGLTRLYRIHVPQSYNGSKPVPLVLALHGGGGSADNAELGYGFDPLADKDGFIVVYPQGAPDPPTGNHWNDGREAARFPNAGKVDDLGFFRALIGQLQADYKIDPFRIYATGLSNGGFMSQRLGMELSDILAGIGPAAGTLGVDVAKQFAPKHPVHVIELHGTRDLAVPIKGGMVVAQGGVCIAVTNVIELWVRHNGCKTPPVVEDLPKKTGDPTRVQRTAYAAGSKGAEVVLYVIEGQGHNWAGRGTANPKAVSTTKELHAEEVIWEFFRKHPKAE